MSDERSRLRHDLLTPLNHIIGFSELLEEEAAQSNLPQFTADLQKIRRAAGELLAMIETNLMPGAAAAPRIRSAATAAVLPAPTASDPSSPQLRGRLLVVDDEATNREVLARRLERHGSVVASAENGEHALELLAREPFDLVLLDVMMPGLDGEDVLRRIKSHSATRDLPVIMVSALDEVDRVARCIEIGAEDYLPKPFNATLLRARVGACLERKRLRDDERRAHAALAENQRQLAIELADAADYVESLLPAPLTGPIAADWRFIPSRSLGGDAFGYHWLDDDHLAVYLLDVCGHGVGTALLSVSAVNVLRSGSVPGVDVRHPGEVLAALNRAFPLEQQNNLYFTAWYGVYRLSTRRLVYSGGGHPPAILLQPDTSSGSFTSTELAEAGMTIGIWPDAIYPVGQCTVAPGSRLFVFSDGAYEIERPGGEMWTREEFAAQLPAGPADGAPDLDRLVALARSVGGRPDFEDDLSIVRVTFA